ncbi:MAG: hypothetical protein WKF43_09955 [Acidimicrobiales bacterium]
MVLPFWEASGVLSDGSYEAIVVDAADDDDGSGSIVVELTVLSGTHKGEMVSVTARGWRRDPLDLLAVPATITVVDGEPAVHLEG